MSSLNTKVSPREHRFRQISLHWVSWYRGSIWWIVENFTHSRM